MGLLADLRQEAQNIMDSGVVQRNGHTTSAGAKQIGRADGIRKVCNAVQKQIADILRDQPNEDLLRKRLREMVE